MLGAASISMFMLDRKNAQHEPLNAIAAHCMRWNAYNCRSRRHIVHDYRPSTNGRTVTNRNITNNNSPSTNCYIITNYGTFAAIEAHCYLLIDAATIANRASSNYRRKSMLKKQASTDRLAGHI